jgi:hypothetical protein
VPLERGGVALGDPLRDAPQGELDIVGDERNPAAYIFRDANFIYFRLRLNSNPQRSVSDYAQFAWGVEFDTGNTDTYEFLAVVNGLDDEVQLWENVTGSGSNPRDIAENQIAQWPVETHARVVPAPSNFGGDADTFLDWAIEIQALQSAGLNLQDPIRFIFGTSTNKQTLDRDLLSPTSEETIDRLGSDPVNCSGATCTPPGCQTDADCTDLTRPVCQPNGSCGECSAANNGVCTAGEVCNVPSGTCGSSCTSDAQCGGSQPACQPSGVCGECSASNNSGCPATRPRCNTAAGVCEGTTSGAGGAPGILTEDNVHLTGGACACRAPGRPASAGALGALALAALLGFARRRRAVR